MTIDELGNIVKSVSSWIISAWNCGGVFCQLGQVFNIKEVDFTYFVCNEQTFDCSGFCLRRFEADFEHCRELLVVFTALNKRRDINKIMIINGVLTTDKEVLAMEGHLWRAGRREVLSRLPVVVVNL